MNLLAAITIGLLGSMHCIGMCGPLILAVPSTALSRWKYILERSIYTIGKALTYAIMGAFVGWAGNRILIDIQQNISVILGLSILITIAIPLAFKSKWRKYSPLKYLYLFIQNRFSEMMRKRGRTALFMMGMLNGLLPCGLVYTALVGATVVADIWHSALFMVVFGLGTAPALIIVSLSGKLIAGRFQTLIRRLLPALSITLAVILILRGLNLGIPLISPKVSQTTHSGNTLDCCD